jgi:hypothetical protein
MNYLLENLKKKLYNKKIDFQFLTYMNQIYEFCKMIMYECIEGATIFAES